MGLLILAAAALGVWRRSDPLTVAALVMIVPTIQYARFTPFTAPLLLIAVLACLVERAPWLTMSETGSMRRNAERPAIQRLSWGILAAGAVFILAQAPSNLEAASYKPLPETAVDRLIACGAPAPVWNDYNWGGYLLWRGDGQYTVGIDGRAEALYSVDAFDDYLTVLNGQIGWEQIVQDSPATYALINANAVYPIESLPGWRVVYSDDIATLASQDGAIWTCS
jgi:hypothetical protein